MSSFLWCIFCILTLIARISIAQSPMLNSEKQAFYLVLEALCGEYNSSNLYPDPCGLTPVPGTSCDQFGNFWHITSLNLGDVYDNSAKCGPNAALHSAIFNLTHLKTLSLYKCFVNTPQIMPSNHWSTLAGSLQTLILRNNVALVGELPSEIGKLSNLEFLVITENNMKGVLPQEIGNLPRLKKLVLSHNQFYGNIPYSLGLLQELLILDLSFNQLQGQIPQSLGNLNSVVKMDLSDNGFNSGIPPTLGELKALTFLDLRNNQLQGDLPHSLTQMINLQELYLGNNPMGGVIEFLDWSNLQLLMSLDLSASGCSGKIPDSLGKLKMLRYLALNNNNLSGKVPQELADLPNLGSLLLDNNNLSGPLEFSSKFYQRMGRYLTLWGNPRLCYAPEEQQRVSFLPNGVGLCSRILSPGKNHQASLIVGSGVKRYSWRLWILVSVLRYILMYVIL